MGKGKHLGNTGAIKKGAKGPGVNLGVNFRKDRGFRYSDGVLVGSITFKLDGMTFTN